MISRFIFRSFIEFLSCFANKIAEAQKQNLDPDQEGGQSLKKIEEEEISIGVEV